MNNNNYENEDEGEDEDYSSNDGEFEDNDQVFPDTAVADPANWPACPNCKSREVLVAHSTLKCLDCHHSGSISRKPTVLKFLDARYHRTTALNADCFQFGKFPQVVESDFGDILMERTREMHQELVFEREIFRARNVFATKGKFTPVAVTIPFYGRPPTLLNLGLPVCDNPAVARMLLADQARGMTAIAVMFQGNDFPSMDFMSTEPTGAMEPDSLIINVHTYGSRALMGHIPLGDLGAPIKWNPSFCMKEVIWQPVDWNLFCGDGVHEVIRYAAVVEIEGDINVTISVMEKMDGGLMARINYRDPVTGATSLRKTIKADTVEEAIEKAKAKFQSLLSNARELAPDGVSMSFELEWGMEVGHFAVLHQIRAAVANKGGKVE